MTLATVLLAASLVGETTFIVIMSLTTFSSLAVYLSPRLLEVNVKEMRLVLAQLEKVKAEIDAMYGGIEKLKREPLKTDSEWHNRLGAGGGLVSSGAVMNYVSGCMKRERERLAQIFILGNTPEKTAAALVDHTKDDLVFKWEPGSVSLDVGPRSTEDRRKAKAAREASRQEGLAGDKSTRSP